jgi:hypothetical protein
MHARVGIALLIVGVTTAATGCTTPRDDRIEPVYDRSSGRLQLLKYDENGDGTIDTWSYMDGARVVRIELDRNQDAIIDRWEYYRSNQTIEKVGTSRVGANTPDAWAFYDAGGAITRLELSIRRNGQVDRVEFYERGVRVRAEEDTNGDGQVDKWEVYEGARLESIALDTRHRGAPDRRIRYAQDGTVNVEPLP